MQLTTKQKKKWKKEIEKCRDSFDYFANKHCKISQMDSKKGLIRIKQMKLYPYQSKAVEIFENNKYTIFKKPRQMGISVLVGTYCLWLALFNKYQLIVVVSEGQVKAIEFIDKIRTTYDHLHEILKGDLITDNKGSLEFSTHSKIVSKPCKESVGRSDTPTLLIMDEVAFMSRKTSGTDNLAQQIFSGAEPALNLGGKGILISTPNGVGNFYHRTYVKAKEGNNDFYAFEINWWERPDYAVNMRKTDDSKGFPGGWTSDWLDKKVANSTEYRKDILQETFAQFLGSGRTLLKINQIDALFNTKPVVDGLFDGKFKAWLPVDRTHSYCIGVDTAEGLIDNDEADSNCLQVFDCTLNQQAGEYVSRTQNDIYTTHAEKLIKIYGNALTNIENNGVGYATVIGLKGKDLNLYKHNRKIGTTMSGRTTRPLLIKLYRQLPRLDMKFHSMGLKDEMYSFVDKNGKAEHESGCHDDRIMALLLALMIRDRAFLMHPTNPLISDNMAGGFSTSDIRKEIEKLDVLLTKEEDAAEDDANDNYLEALSYGMTPEYIETYNMLIGK